MVSKGMVSRETSLTKMETRSGDSSTAEIAKSEVAEILIFGIPEASGLRGSIRLVKLVSQVLARAHNLAYGPKLYQTCIHKFKNISKTPDPPPQQLLCYPLAYLFAIFDTSPVPIM